jgi:predicted phosphodiesterase
MRKVLLSWLFCVVPVTAQAEGTAWVQATASGYEVRAIPEYESCPALMTEGGSQIFMTVRAERNGDFPRICSALLPKAVRSLKYANLSTCPDNGEVCVSGGVFRPLPLPVANPQRILVLGDTGCRINGATLQACNDPARWPFPQLAQAAAKLKPDLIIHVGDYLYRESACPLGNQGCAGSPWGDNWTTWQADFYTPAAPLLAAAPIVLVRGNHEDCLRAGPGWLRLQGPLPFDSTAPCAAHLSLYNVDLGELRLAVMDDATAEETQLNRDASPVFAADLTDMAAIPAPVWFVHHRPIWAAVTGPLGIPIGGNLGLMDAGRIASLRGGPPIASNVELMLSGHIHSFEAINYTKDVPPQIVAGNGGDDLLVTPKNLRGTQFLGHSGVTVADGLSVGGFGFLLMTRAMSGWTIDLYDSAGNKTRTCRFTTGKSGRVDCPP